MSEELKGSVEGYEVKVTDDNILRSPRFSIRVGGCFLHFQSIEQWQKVKYKVDSMIEEMEKITGIVPNKL